MNACRAHSSYPVVSGAVPHAGPGASGRGRAFTLIELLMVITIVGVLAGLLLPALARTRQGAGTAVCASHLRQFGLAAQMYWDDHDGASFPYRGAAMAGGDVFWFGWLARGEEGERDFDPRPGALWPYLQGRGVEQCPGLRRWGPDFKPKARPNAGGGGACGYGYNLTLSPAPAHGPLRVQQYLRPSDLVIFADAAQVNDFQAPASPEHPLLEEFYYVSALEPTTHFRHQERAEAAFADGHVRGERPVAGSLDPRLPSAGVGRLRPTLLTPP